MHNCKTVSYFYSVSFLYSVRYEIILSLSNNFRVFLVWEDNFPFQFKCLTETVFLLLLCFLHSIVTSLWKQEPKWRHETVFQLKVKTKTPVFVNLVVWFTTWRQILLFIWKVGSWQLLVNTKYCAGYVIADK
jgi:hypothetical protein